MNRQDGSRMASNLGSRTAPARIGPGSAGFLIPLLLSAMLFLSGCQDPPEGKPGEKTPPAADAGIPAPSSPAPDMAAIRTNNRAVGLMGRFEYAAARDLFADLADRYPHWTEVKVNLAIATLNRQREGDEEVALALVDGVLVTHPGQARAHYVAGLLRLYLASSEEAMVHFAQVAAFDPFDAYAAYYLGQCLAQQSEPEKALAAYRRALAADPYLRSAAYGAFQALQRLRRPDEARDFIEQYQRLGGNPRARLAEFKYTRMGPKAEALAVGGTVDEPTAPPPEGPLFTHPVETPGSFFLQRPEAGARPLGMTVVDPGSGEGPSLFVAGAGPDGGNGQNRFFGLTPEGELAPREEDHPLTRISHVNAALWGDFDNDGKTDVYLCRRGANQLWQNAGNGRWQDITAATGTGNGDLDTVDGAFFDADHDGDLDIFLVNGNGPDGFLYNNRDGTFRPGTIGGQDQDTVRNPASLTVIPADLDRDRDADLILLGRAPPHRVYLNDRLWAYHKSPGFAAFEASPALSAVVGDVDSDGKPEIFTLTPGGQVIRWSRNVRGDLTPLPLPCASAGNAVGCLAGDLRAGKDPGKDPGKDADKVIPWAQMALLDADGDGAPELVIATPAGWSVIRVAEKVQNPPAGEVLFAAAAPGGGAFLGMTPFLSDPGKGFGIAALYGRTPPVPEIDKDRKTSPAALAHWAPGPGRHPFLALSLSGREETAKSMRSNASGIGARISARAGTGWTILENFRDHAGPGQGLQPTPVGLGPSGRLDFAAIDWPDGVLQTELDLDAGHRHRITETQRQLSSCPVLFAWDGEKYAFITDFLGVGGMGYALGPGEYSVPRPWENLLLPPTVRPREGRYLMKLTEPMEEVAYVDAVGLTVYDLPPGWQMALDERMGVEGPEPTGKPVFFRREMLPRKAVNERGEDVIARILEADGRAAPVGALDLRFIGRLAGEHILTLTFSREFELAPEDGPGAPPVLIIDGWVEYPYSQTMFAAWQANAAFDAPTVEALGADGQWHSVLTRFGYPAGMPRRMSVPLAGLPAGTSALRLRTNQEIYWDRIAIAFPEPFPDRGKRHVLPLVDAHLGIVGFPERTDGSQRRPGFDYARRRPFQDTRPMAGFYTRPGPVRELLAGPDEALAIFGAGEEVHLVFEAPADPPAAWRRYPVLETHGWTKDRDLYTKDGDTVGPLPSGGRDGERRALLHARYNNRVVFD